MRYVLPIASNMCSYSTSAKMKCQISSCLTIGTGFISTKRFCTRSRRYMPARMRREEHLLWLFCWSCQVLLVFLTVFFFYFLTFMLTMWTVCLYCISCVVCYEVEELRSEYDGKLQFCNMYITFSSGVFLQKCQNWAWERKKVLWK